MLDILVHLVEAPGFIFAITSDFTFAAWLSAVLHSIPSHAPVRLP